MKREYPNQKTVQEVLKSAVWLAWQACGGPTGLGALQNNPDASRDEVWNRIHSAGDYAIATSSNGRVNADYVFGRMMKLRFAYDGNSILAPDDLPRVDYQAWCSEYPTYGDLFDAAERDVGVTK